MRTDIAILGFGVVGAGTAKVLEMNKEEIAELEQNPGVEKATANTVSFTAEFKRIAYEQLADGRTLREILSEIGVRPEILGDARLWGLASRLRQNTDREEGYADLRKKNCRRTARETPERTEKEELKALRHKVAYMEQEIEFLKKVQAADTEARKSWESRQRRK